MKSQATLPYWDPLWLRKSVLFAFMATFILFSVGLVLMWYLVNRFDGIPLTLTTNHYAWTYGPTAILTMVVSLWRRVNYCTMVNQPWQELHDGPQEASKTVLLDYIWPFQLTSLVSALRNRHLAVSASITISTLLKLVMAISTTLFMLENSSLSQNITVRKLRKFSNEGYNSSSVFVWDYLVLREQYGKVAAPVEISTAFTNYSIISDIPVGAGEASTIVDVLQVNVTCEKATVSWSQHGPGEFFNVTVFSPTCGINTFQQIACKAVNCTSTASYFFSDLFPCADPGGSHTTIDGDRYVLVTIEADLSPVPSTQEGVWPSFGVTVRRNAAVTCSLEYSINQGVARGPAHDTSRVDSLQVTQRVQSQMGNFTNSDMLTLVFFITTWSSSIRVHDSLWQFMEIGNQDNIVAFLAGTRNITRDSFDTLLDASILKSRAEEIFAGLSHQFVRKSLMVSDDTTVPGSVDYTEQKLHARAVALWAMVGLLSIMSFLVTVIIAHVKPRVAPQPPASIATAVYTISRSPSIGMLLEEPSAIRLSQIRKELANYDFTAAWDRTGMPRINAVAVVRPEALPKPPSWISRKWKSISSNRTKESTDLKPTKKRDWMPYSNRRHAITLTMLLPVVAIAALEVLWHFSENNERFVIVSSDSSIASYSIRYGSTATVLIISTFFNALDFAIATMTPFSALAAGYATAEHTMFFTIAGDIPPVALYKAIYHMHLGAALSQVASTVGGLLTIVASGLWFNTPIEISRDVNVEIQSGWSIDFTGISSPSNDTVDLFNDLEHGFPEKATLVWDNIVLPKIGNPQLSITSELRGVLNGDTRQYNIAVPAIQPILDCSVSTLSTVTVDDLPANDNTTNPSLVIMTRFSLAAECGSSSFGYRVSHDHFSTFWIGKLFDLPVNSGSPSPASVDCPSLGAIFGTYEHSQSQPNITTLVCTQRIQWVEANTVYLGNSSTLYTPDLNADLHLTSATPKNITDARSGSSSLTIAVAEPLSRLDSLGDTDNTVVAETFDEFFNHLIYGPNGTSSDNLLGSDNVNTLMSDMNNVYQRFMVRVIDREWRVGFINGNTTQSIPNDGVARGTMTVTALRLKLNKRSKIVLQALLGTMVLLGGIGWWCVDMRVLPRNPYPIASSMALFAGSRLIRATGVNRGQEQQRTIKRKPLVIVKGKRFRLGWWQVPRVTVHDSRENDLISQAPSSRLGRRFGIDVEDEDKNVSSTVSKTATVSKRGWLR